MGIVSGIKSPPLARTPPHGIYIDRCISGDITSGKMTFEMTSPVTVLVDAWPNNALLLTFPRTPASLPLRSIKAYIRTSTIHDAYPIAFRFADSLDRTVLTKEMDPARRWRVSSHKNTAIWIFIFQSWRRPFHIFVVVQQRLSNVQKSMMHVQRCCLLI